MVRRGRHGSRSSNHRGGRSFLPEQVRATKKLTVEKKAGKPLFLNIGHLNSPLGVSKVIVDAYHRYINGMSMMESTANTALVCHSGSLFVLGEAGLPYRMGISQDNVIHTKGSESFSNIMKTPFTAHPKTDPRTSRMYGIGVPILPHQNSAQLYTFDEGGRIVSSFPVPLRKKKGMIHDSAITVHYRLILDYPFEMDYCNIFKGKFPLGINRDMVSRIGFLPLDAKNCKDVKWVVLDDQVVSFHVVNAWGDGDRVVLLTCDMEEVCLEDLTRSTPYLYRIVVDIKTWKVVSRVRILDRFLDFPTLNKNYLGVESEFGYFLDASIGDTIVKVNLITGKVVGTITETSRFLGDCEFIPSMQDDKEEDDGYISTFTTSKFGKDSDYRIYDAKSLDSVCKISFPARIPLGFHSLFVDEKQLISVKKLTPCFL